MQKEMNIQNMDITDKALLFVKDMYKKKFGTLIKVGKNWIKKKDIKIIIDVKLLDESGNMTAKSEQLVNKINALGYMGNDVNKLKQLAAVR